MVERVEGRCPAGLEQNGLSISQRARCSGVPLLCLTPTSSVAWRAGWVERGAGGLTSRMRPRRDRGQQAGWRAQPRARD